MIELHIYIEPVPGQEHQLERVYWTDFAPAVSSQQGFQRTTLIKRRDALRAYQINLAFDTEELRLNWASSALHEQVWPKIASLCQRVSWTGFDTVEKPGHE